MAQVKTSIASSPAQPAVRTLTLVEKEYGKTVELIGFIEKRIADSKRQLDEADSRLKMAGQPIAEIHKQAGIKRACEVALAADEPALRSLRAEEMRLYYEAEGIKDTLRAMLRQRAALLDNINIKNLDRKIKQAQDFIAERQFERLRLFEEPAAELERKAMALAG